MYLKASSSIADRNIEKSVGSSTHPCLTPFVIANVSETSPPFLFTIIPVCRLSIMVVNFSGHPYFLSSCHSPLPFREVVHHHSGMQTFYHGCDPSKDLAGCRKKRYTSVINTLCSVSFFVDGDYVGILPGLWYMAFLPYFDDPSVQSVGQVSSPVFPYFCWNSVSTWCFSIF